MDKKAIYKLSYGLFVLTAKDGDKDNGCIVNTVTQLTSDPLQISVTVNKMNFTHDMIMKTGMFNVSILTENSKFSAYKHWGFQSGKDTDKTIGIDISRSENGIIYTAEDTNAYISAKVVSSVDVGTHTMFIAQVTDCQVLSDAPSVTYDFYQKFIKEKAPVKAAVKGYICTVCGYIYEGETLPPDFICPLCKHGSDDFERI